MNFVYFHVKDKLTPLVRNISHGVNRVLEAVNMCSHFWDFFLCESMLTCFLPAFAFKSAVYKENMQ